MTRIFKTSRKAISWGEEQNKLCIGNYLPVDANGNPVWLTEKLGDIKTISEKAFKEILNEIHFEADRRTAIAIFRVLREIRKGDIIIIPAGNRSIDVFIVPSNNIETKVLCKDPELVKKELLPNRETWELLCIPIKYIGTFKTDDITYSKIPGRPTITRVHVKGVVDAVKEFLKEKGYEMN